MNKKMTSMMMQISKNLRWKPMFWLMSSALVSSFLVVAQLDSTQTECPQYTTLIYPCSCENGTLGQLIRCERSNLAVLAKSLRQLRGQVDKIEIEDCAVPRILGKIFEDSSSYEFHHFIRELAIRASGLQTVEPNITLSPAMASKLNFVSLDRNKLTRVPLELLNQLPNLKQLNLSSNMIASIGLNSFARLSNMSELDLSHNKLAQLEDRAFSGLSMLEVLSLRANSLTKLDKATFSALKKLRSLDLSFNKLSSLDRSALQDLSSLEVLSVAHNQLATLHKSALTRNARLLNLDLSFNKLTEIDSYLLKGTRFLRHLNAAGNSISEITRNLFAPITRVKSIDLSRNQFKSLAAESFKSLAFLDYIDLSRNQIANISDHAFSGLFQLHIDLSHNNLSKIMFRAFSEVANMSKLDLSHNSLDQGVSMYAFDQADCTHLDLSHNLIRDISRFPITNLTGLKFLDLRFNHLTELNKKSFGDKKSMYELHTIDASNNNLSSISGNVLEKLASIRMLNLSHNSLERLTSSSFGNSPTLLELDLSHNNLSDISSATLNGLISTRSLIMSHNKLKKMTPIPVGLSVIRLDNNQISQLTESAFPSLNALLELYLDNNRIGQLSKTALNNLMALRVLSISANNFSQVPAHAMGSLISLQTINMSANRIQQLPRKAFGSLPNMFDIRLDQNNITSLDDWAFEGMPQLISLNLSHNQLVELPAEAFHDLVSLRTLDVSHNQLTRFENKTRSAMEDLLSLEQANLSYNRLSTITPITFITSPYIPHRLKSLDLSNNLIGILMSHFALGMNKLERLDLRSNIINEIMPGTISNMTELAHLDLSYNKLRTLKQFTFVEMGNVKKSVNKLSVVLLNNNRLTSFAANEFDKLPNLTELDLASNRLKSIFPELNSWVMRRGVKVDLSGNQDLGCSCQQLPLIAWVDSLLNRSYSYSTSHQLTELKLSSSKLDQFEQSARVIDQVKCAQPNGLKGKSMMSMIEGYLPNELACDRNTLLEADRIKRLKAPIQINSIEPMRQGFHISWTLLDSRLELINYLVLTIKFTQPFELAKFRWPSYNFEELSTIQQTAGNLSASDNLKRNELSSSLESIDFIGHNLTSVPYDQSSLVLTEVEVSNFNVVCVTHKSDPVQENSAARLLEKLDSDNSSKKQSSLIVAAILADYSKIDCVELKPPDD